MIKFLSLPRFFFALVIFEWFFLPSSNTIRIGTVCSFYFLCKHHDKNENFWMSDDFVLVSVLYYFLNAYFLHSALPLLPLPLNSCDFNEIFFLIWMEEFSLNANVEKILNSILTFLLLLRFFHEKKLKSFFRLFLYFSQKG